MSSLPIWLLLIIGAVSLVILSVSIIATRRKHPGHIHKLWYTFSVTFYSNSHFDFSSVGRDFVSSPKAQQWALVGSSRHGGIGGGLAKASVSSRSSQDGKIRSIVIAASLLKKL